MYPQMHDLMIQILAYAKIQLISKRRINGMFLKKVWDYDKSIIEQVNGEVIYTYANEPALTYGDKLGLIQKVGFDLEVTEDDDENPKAKLIDPHGKRLNGASELKVYWIDEALRVLKPYLDVHRIILVNIPMPAELLKFERKEVRIMFEAHRLLLIERTGDRALRLTEFYRGDNPKFLSMTGYANVEISDIPKGEEALNDFLVETDKQVEKISLEYDFEDFFEWLESEVNHNGFNIKEKIRKMLTLDEVPIGECIQSFISSEKTIEVYLIQKPIQLITDTE